MLQNVHQWLDADAASQEVLVARVISDAGEYRPLFGNAILARHARIAVVD